MSSDNIFEIREYLDNEGAPLKQEVVDITKEMEHFAKAGGDKIDAMEALDVSPVNLSFTKERIV
jgi:hypothetical protein